MSSSDEFFPFDGTCECSKDADFTLTFDDRTCLKFSKCLLEMASRVLKTAIKECQHDGTLHLSDTSKGAWRMILNCIHPAGRAASCVEHVITSSWESLADVLRQCDKYAFVSLKGDIDERQAKALDEKRERAIDVLRFAPRETMSIARQGRGTLMDPEMAAFKSVREFDLPKSEEATSWYIADVKKELDHLLAKGTPFHNGNVRRECENASSCIKRIIREMHDAGRYELCSWIFVSDLEEAKNT